MQWRLLALALEITAVACGIVAYVNRQAPIEGVYFGTGDDAIVTSSGGDSWFEPFDFSQPYLWAGAGVAFVVTGMIVFLLAKRA